MAFGQYVENMGSRRENASHSHMCYLPPTFYCLNPPAMERGLLHTLTKIELQKLSECTIKYHKHLLNHSSIALWSLGLEVE